MVYTRQQVLEHYNNQRGTTFTLTQLGTLLLTERLRAELKEMLREDANAAEEAQVNSL
jgi:hypothetical protein